MSYYLQIQCLTWNKDTNFLFDYQSKDTNYSSVEITQPGFLLKSGKFITFSPTSNKANKIKYEDDQYLGFISMDKKDEYRWTFNNNFSFKDFKEKNQGKDPSQIKFLDDLDWIIVSKSNFNSKRKTKEYKLKEGDFIKIGKIMLQVTMLQSDSLSDEAGTNRHINKSLNNNMLETDVFKNIYAQSKQMLLNVSTNNFNLSNVNSIQANNITNNINISCQEQVISHKKKKSKTRICRICLVEEEESKIDPNNPIISVCKCTGSVKYIHLECIRKWFTQKITWKPTNDERIQAFSYKEFECEICKTKIPLKIKLNGETIFLVGPITLDPPYIIFETLQAYSRFNHHQENSNAVYVFIISFKNSLEKIYIGRSNDSSLRLTDISVSRNHLILYYNNGYFYIEDNKSKFGTLILVQNDIIFYPNQLLALQIGKYHLIIKLIKKFWRMFFCEKTSYLEKQNYDTYLEKIPSRVYIKQIESMKYILTENWSENSNSVYSKENTSEEETNKSGNNEWVSKISKNKRYAKTENDMERLVLASNMQPSNNPDSNQPIINSNNNNNDNSICGLIESKNENNADKQFLLNPINKTLIKSIQKINEVKEIQIQQEHKNDNSNKSNECDKVPPQIIKPYSETHKKNSSELVLSFVKRKKKFSIPNNFEDQHK